MGWARSGSCDAESAVRGVFGLACTNSKFLRAR